MPVTCTSGSETSDAAGFSAFSWSAFRVNSPPVRRTAGADPSDAVYRVV